MARQAAEDGIEAICATPHIRHDHDVRIDEIDGAGRGAQRDLRERGVAGPGPARGRGRRDRRRAASTTRSWRRVALGAGRWVLLEPAPGPLSDSLERRVEELARRGHRALIAHPERHLADDMFERLARLVADGALVQATADFFLREDSAPGMLELAGRGLVHVLGSDSHSSRFGRAGAPRRRDRAAGRVERLAPHLEWIARTAPRAIVEGRPVEPPFEPI